MISMKKNKKNSKIIREGSCCTGGLIEPPKSPKPDLPSQYKRSRLGTMNRVEIVY